MDSATDVLKNVAEASYFFVDVCQMVKRSVFSSNKVSI